MMFTGEFCNYGSRFLIFVGSNAFYIIHWTVDIHVGEDFPYFQNIFIIMAVFPEDSGIPRKRTPSNVGFSRMIGCAG